jgi:Mn2+/Fe2+ NRAMP family transporter
MAARLGLVTRKTLFDVTRTKFGKGFARLGGLFGFLSILAFQAGNSAAVGFSGDAFFGLGSRFWSVLFLIPALGLLLFPNLYARLELLVKCVVIVMIAGFVGTLFVVGVDIAGFVRGLRPGFPDGNSVFLSLGMVGTTFSIAAAAYQNYLMREKGWGVKDLSKEGLDSLIGIAILGGISMIILLTSARVINASNQEILSAQGMAVQLEPLFGRVAFYLFGCGFFFASFPSLIVNPLIGASLLVDGFGGSPSMENRTVRRWAATAMGVGVGVVLLFNGNPVELLRIAQALAVVAFPVLGFLV